MASSASFPEGGGDNNNDDDDETKSFASAHEEGEEEYYDDVETQEDEGTAPPPPQEQQYEAAEDPMVNMQNNNNSEGYEESDDYIAENTATSSLVDDSSASYATDTNNNNNNNMSITDSNMDESAGPCFFADATLDLEEAHGLAETPIATTQKGKVGADIVDALSDVNLGGVGGREEHSHPLMVVEETKKNQNLKSQAEVDDKTRAAVAEHAQHHLDNHDNSNNNNNTPNNNNNNNTQPITTKTMNRITNTILGSGTALSTKNPNSSEYTSSLMLNVPLPTTTSSMETSGAASLKPSNLPTYRPKPPRKPRDLGWAVVAILFIPCSFILPYYYFSADKHNEQQQQQQHQQQQSYGDWYQTTTTLQGNLTTTLSTILTTLLALISCRILYRTTGGGDGDDERHILSKYIVSSSSVSFMLNFVLMIMIYWRLNDAWYYALLPAYFFVKDLIAMREEMMASSSSSAARSGGGGAGNNEEEEDLDGRKTFFRELVCMALDILSRSLRRSSFYRLVSIAMVVQFGLVLVWRSALFTSIKHASMNGGGGGGKIMVLIAFLGGKWATGIVARILGLIASGGITSWFAQQSILMEEMDRMKSKRLELQQQQQQQQQVESTAAAAGGDSKDGAGSEVDTMSDDYSVGYGGNRSDAAARAAARAALHAMPEAYRTADASAYRSVIEFDEGIDDDYFDEDGEDEDDYYDGEEDSFIGVASPSSGGGGGGGSADRKRRKRRSTAWTGGGSGGGSTVKSFLFSAVTVSFGSVAQCGLLGGLAQLVWSVVRNVDAAKLFVSRRLRGRGGLGSGFRGMEISSSEGGDGSGGAGDGGQMARIVGGGGNRGGGMDFRQTVESWRQTAAVLWNRFDLMARAFVRSHSDLALSHVAAYFKGYNRAANDVAALIEASGVEPIIHDDITTHMCSSVCSAVSGCIVILFGNIVANHRHIKGSPHENLSDAAVCEIMLVVFIMCYTIMFAVMEPLRASIKAIYVCFAQHPQSLSQAFPLIFHRLSRISEANLV